MYETRKLALSIVCCAAIFGSAVISAQAAGEQSPAPQKEADLISLLRSEAPKAEKALACKHLAIYGSSQAVPELAQLLADEELASWARIALEAIPGPTADEALRKSLGSLQGKLLVGAINSIGVRRDATAVDLLAGRLQDSDLEVVSAAAAALGRIGTEGAARSLRQPLQIAPDKVRAALAEGLVLCAERLQSEGRSPQAIEIFDLVRKADVPKQRVLEATRGAILARKHDGIPLLLEQFQSSDKDLFQIALSTFREFPGREVDEAFAAEIPRAAPERAVLAIQAMADRRETVVLSAVLNTARSGPKSVRVAAIRALGRVGDVTCVVPMLDMVLEDDKELSESAKESLAVIPGENVDKDIVARLPNSEGKMHLVLIELVGQRRIQVIDELAKALDNPDKLVRSAALNSLGATVSAKDLNLLISQVVTPKHAEDMSAAERALKTAAIRMPDRETCAAELAGALEQSGLSTKIALLQILADVGGEKALGTVGTAAKSSDPELKDAASRLLGEWMTIDAAPVLMELAKSGPSDKFQVRALRGYIRIARQFVMPDEQRIEMCRNALMVSHQPAERKLVLDVLKRYSNIESLKLAVKMTQGDSALKDEAAQTALAIAQKLVSKTEDVRQILSTANLQKVKLEIVKAEFGAGDKQIDVTESLQKLAAESQLIVLPSSGYAATFGIDPVPGAAKQLRIQYRINGQAGDASFAENTLIILPVPQ